MDILFLGGSKTVDPHFAQHSWNLDIGFLDTGLPSQFPTLRWNKWNEWILGVKWQVELPLFFSPLWFSDSLSPCFFSFFPFLFLLPQSFWYLFLLQRFTPSSSPIFLLRIIKTFTGLQYRSWWRKGINYQLMF